AATATLATSRRQLNQAAQISLIDQPTGTSRNNNNNNNNNQVFTMQSNVALPRCFPATWLVGWPVWI
ncbi:MAG: hypothetical protein N6V41_01175, partial [Candidatus Portiera aleyrodidarum]|nr:hypothetical protein [Candidatus Portiera aleyrodidarum]